ncbi:uncharacterized protein GGS22DRAFT_197476 [Annulohypoxylon maeteangense]|uniref:uncharacterized protein n=1 Tax=Annulohypoxylon maeteangense TaxID=1927788 RepID=UPI0020084DB9|nr:uncharacterized protein GGS22DRAFT_197476 [Annulohypoxylon maeteangense]KAI0880555.1 hypothetical protein GGS22DRAFT_197476 [Annulohypoxylon maeteangense]
MAPKPSNKVQKDVQLTSRDMEILSFAWQCFEGQPKIDFEKLAKVASFKNSATARVCFSSVKKKILGASESGETSTPATPRGKRAARDQMTPSSSKKTKLASKSPRNRKVLPKAEEDDDEKISKTKPWSETESEKDAEIMSGLLGFDVKKEMETDRDSDDDDEDESEA